MTSMADTRRAILRLLVERDGLANTARRFGKPDRQINDMLAGRKSFGEKVARDMEERYDPTRAAGWLDDPESIRPSADGQITQNPPSSANESDVREQHVRYVVRRESVTIPQYDVAGAMGNGGLMLADQPGTITDWHVTPEWIAKNVPHSSGVSNLCIVTGFGDSMRPLYNPGDPLLVDTGVRKIEADAVYFFRVGAEGYIKRIQRIPGKGYLVKSANPEYETWTLTPDMDVQVLGRVLMAWRSEKF